MPPSSVARPALAYTSQNLTIDDDNELRATHKKNQCLNIRTRSSKSDKRSSLVPSDVFFNVNDKRGYSVEEQIEGRERGAKKREKVSKKLGRKPIVSEPTSKRKAQNRAAQRAFRERKEKYLRELEAKVENLEKTSEEMNNENSLLRAHLEKVSLELSGYQGKHTLLMKATQNANNYELPSCLSMRTPETSHVAGNSYADFRFDCPIFKNLPRCPMEKNATQKPFNTQLMPSNIQATQAKPPSRNTPFLDTIAKTKTFNYSVAKVQKVNSSNLPKLLDTSLSECPNSNISLLKNTHVRIHDSKSEPNTAHTKSLDTNFSCRNYSDTYSNLNNSSLLFPSNLGNTFSSLEQPQERTEQPFIINESLNGPKKPYRDDSTYLCELEQDKFYGENSTVYETPNFTFPQISSCHQNEIDIREFELSSFPNNGAGCQTRLFDHQIDLQLYKNYYNPHDNILSSGTVYNRTRESSILVPAFHDTVNHENSSLFDKDDQSNKRLFDSEPTQEDLHDCSNILDRIKNYSRTIHNNIDLEKLCRDLKKKAKCSDVDPVAKNINIESILKCCAPSAAKSKVDNHGDTT